MKILKVQLGWDQDVAWYIQLTLPVLLKQEKFINAVLA